MNELKKAWQEVKSDYCGIRLCPQSITYCEKNCPCGIVEKAINEHDSLEIELVGISQKLRFDENILLLLKNHLGFDFAVRFGNNQTMMRVTNKRTKEYWEIPIPKNDYDLFATEGGLLE